MYEPLACVYNISVVSTTRFFYYKIFALHPNEALQLSCAAILSAHHFIGTKIICDDWQKLSNLILVAIKTKEGAEADSLVRVRFKISGTACVHIRSGKVHVSVVYISFITLMS